MVFKSLVVGKFNELVTKAGELVCESPGNHYPLLVIYGEPGSGKSAVIDAIVKNLNKGLSLKSASAHSFTIQLVKAIQGNLTLDFERDINNTDILIIDDIHELKNKTATQGILYRIIKQRLVDKKQSILTSDMIIKNSEGMNPHLMNLISEGLNVEIQRPDFEDRLLLAKHFSQKVYNLSLYDDVITLLAEYYNENLRELLGAIIKLNAINEILKIEITIDVARHYLCLEKV